MADTTRYVVETRAQASRIDAVAGLILLAVAFALPLFASLSLVQELFFILTMLTLAQFWNLLAGYGALVSVGQQAFVGLGAYALLGAAILWGMDPVLALAMLTIGGSYWLLRTKRGLALAAERDSIEAAKSVGVDAVWLKWQVFIVVIGGIGTIEGPIIGVLVFFALQSLLADYENWYLMTLGGLGIVVMLFAPRGLWGMVSDRTGLQLFPIRRRLVRRE